MVIPSQREVDCLVYDASKMIDILPELHDSIFFQVHMTRLAVYTMSPKSRHLQLLVQHILHFNNARCADPRDHVFALLSLCDAEELAQSSIYPDYSKSVQELFHQLLLMPLPQGFLNDEEEFSLGRHVDWGFQLAEVLQLEDPREMVESLLMKYLEEEEARKSRREKAIREQQ